MKKIMLQIAALLIVGVLTFGLGAYFVIDNAIVTNEKHEQGNYIIEINGYAISYWYEK